MKKIIIGIASILLLTGAFFLGKHYGSSSENNNNVVQETTTQSTPDTNATQYNTEPKDRKEEQEQKQALVEKFIRTYLSTDNDSLNNLNSMKQQLTEEVYNKALIEKRGQLKVNKVLTSNVLRVALYQDTYDSSNFIVVAEVDTRDERNQSRIIYSNFFVTVKNGIIETLNLSLEND
jgi:hypothetical protein